MARFEGIFVMEKIEIVCDKKIKLSDFLYNQGLMVSQVKRILKQKDVKIDGKRVDDTAIINPGQVIVFYLDKKVNNQKTKKFDIFFEDENIFVINKKAGIEVCGENGIEGQLSNSIPVHRLDRDTSGLLVMAKNKETEKSLLEAFREHQVVKKYLCEVIGDTFFNGETYSAFLVKNAKESYVKVFDKNVKNASQIFTKFKTIKHGNATSVLDVELLTGKTHQIRAHLAHLGHAILGDNKYGNKEINKKYKESRQKLVCYYLKFKKICGLEYLQDREFVFYPNWFNKKGEV